LITSRHLQRRRRASSIVETVAGLLLIIPLMLFFVDLIGVLMCQTANNALAKEAARAAAEIPWGPTQPNVTIGGSSYPVTTLAQGQVASQAAAQLVVTNFYDNNTSMFTGGANLVTGQFSYDASNSGVVTVQTTMTCNFPFPIPGVPSPNDKQFTLGATATEPIVALLPGQ
jgi:hypothetical protein